MDQGKTAAASIAQSPSRIVDLEAATRQTQSLRIIPSDQPSVRARGRIDLAQAKIDLHYTVAQRDNDVSCHVLRTQLAGVQVLGYNAAYYLAEHQELIPKNWKEHVTVMFWGTLFRGNASDGGGLYTVALVCIADKWFLDFVHMDETPEGSWVCQYPAAALAEESAS